MNNVHKFLLVGFKKKDTLRFTVENEAKLHFDMNYLYKGYLYDVLTVCIILAYIGGYNKPSSKCNKKKYETAEEIMSIRYRRFETGIVKAIVIR